MARAAPRYDSPEQQLPLVAPQADWSGDVHGPVAALHQAIEDRFLAKSEFAAVPLVERPVDALVRNSSRAAGWLVLATAFVATARLIA